MKTYKSKSSAIILKSDLIQNSDTIYSLSQKYGISISTMKKVLRRNDISLLKIQQKNHQITASKINAEKCRKIRQEHYNEGLKLFSEFEKTIPFFRDFIILYLGEGFRKDKNIVGIANSSPQIIAVSDFVLSKLTNKRKRYTLSYYEDMDLEMVIDFWSNLLEIKKEDIHLMKKSNAGLLMGRNHRLEFGIFSISIASTELKAKIVAWMDIVNMEWIKRINKEEEIKLFPPNNYSELE